MVLSHMHTPFPIIYVCSTTTTLVYLVLSTIVLQYVGMENVHALVTCPDV